MTRSILQLSGLSVFTDVSLLVLRGLTGVFLMWGTWDNIVSAERMAEFESFMAGFGFPAPHLLAPLSVYAQFAAGALLAIGLLTRWAALIMVFNFIVGFFMVHLADDFRAQFPALILIAVNLHLAAIGPGRFSIDRLFR